MALRRGHRHEHESPDHRASAGASSIADARLRRPAVVIGDVTSMRVVPRPDAPWLEATVSDGTGRLTCIFTGRRAIAGMVVGCTMRVKGTPYEFKHRRYVYNPAYDLLA